MSRTVVIHQPDFLSYLGFFHRFLQADLWVILDQVQYVSGTARSCKTGTSSKPRRAPNG